MNGELFTRAGLEPADPAARLQPSRTAAAGNLDKDPNRGSGASAPLAGTPDATVGNAPVRLPHGSGPVMAAGPSAASAAEGFGIRLVLADGSVVDVDRIVFRLRDGTTCSLGAAEVVRLHELRGELDVALPGWDQEDSSAHMGATTRRAAHTMARSAVARATREPSPSPSSTGDDAELAQLEDAG